MKTIKLIEKKSKSDFGYFNHESRTASTDEALMKAASELNLADKDVLLWADSSYARHFMDARQTKTFNFMKALRDQVPKLRAELAS